MLKKIFFIFFLMLTSSFLVFGQKQTEKKTTLTVGNLVLNNMDWKIIQVESQHNSYNKFLNQSLQFSQIELTVQQKLHKTSSTSFIYSKSPEQIKTMDFEKTFPNPNEYWYAFDADSIIFNEYFWGTINSFYHLTPIHSAWCAAAGRDANPNSKIYPKNCNSWMV